MPRSETVLCEVYNDVSVVSMYICIKIFEFI